MAPIKTAVILPGGNRVDLIIPLNSGTTLKVLQDLAVERAARYHSTKIPETTDILLRLESQVGAFLHPDDKVEDVVSLGETVFVMLQDSTTSMFSHHAQSEPLMPSSRSANDFQLRVITPHLAHCHEDFRTIPLVADGKIFSSSTTLRDLKQAVADSLEISLGPDEPQTQECNCKMAEMSSSMPHVSAEGSLKVLVVSGFSNVAWMDILKPTSGSIMAGLRHLLGENFEDVKTIHLKGGQQTDDDLFSHLPVVSVCAKSRHSKAPQTATAHATLASTLDLHTAEGPIYTLCWDFSAEKLRLTDLVVNGILQIYAIERKAYSTMSEKRVPGKDAMFGAANHWMLPRMSSSARGSNAFLSSLRVFADKINAKNMDAARQETVLRTIHELTRYLPAVRAVRILMDGKTLQPNECAAIVQTCAEVLRDLVPRSVIENDERRYLEGTRLLWGLVLQRVDTLSKMRPSLSENRMDDVLPYLASFKTSGLRDARTNEPIVDPVQTDLGLMERGCFEAFRPGGIFSQSGAEEVGLISERPNLPELRAAILNGGVAPESSYYDIDAVYASLSYHMVGDDLLKEVREFSRDLSHLGMLCHKVGMPVVHPTGLKSATAPVLTLDRDGYLSVYVGRAACAAPDRDISIFRPLAGTEEAIDVNIVAQLIKPIIRVREQDGTAVFDFFSNGLPAKNAKPTELLMFCVDCSESMDAGSDFQEVNEMPLVPVLDEATNVDDLLVTGEADDPTSLEEVRSWLSDHESFSDMVAIVASTASHRTRTIADEVVDFVSLLTSRELIAKAKQFAKLRSWATRSFLSDAGTSPELQVASLRRLLVGLNVYKAPLCDFLIFEAQKPAHTVARGDEVTNQLSVPPDIVCPISKAVFEDPVTTTDNFTYERLSIERWFQIRRSSPLTGLPLEDLSLRRHQTLYNQAKRWVRGEDILEAAPPARKKSRLSNSSSATELNLNFVTPAGTFSRKVPCTLSLADLYQLAYRGMRGAHKCFPLHSHGSLLDPSDQQLSTRRITSGSDIVANIHPAQGSASLTVPSVSEEHCLIKVYQDSSGLFSYWVPLFNSYSMASVIFRLWRFHLSTTGAFTNKDKHVWSELRDGGDGVKVGKRHNHWDLVSNSLIGLDLSMLIPDEELCQDPLLEIDDENGEQGSATHEGDDRQDHPGPMAYGARYRVLKVEVSRYTSPAEIELEKREKLRRHTRLAVSKQVFGAFINRLIAYDYPTVLGLISFGTSASIAQPLTAIIENFRHAVDRLEASGDTSLWDALALAADQLVHFGQKYPGIPKRIICLSDGVDTKSSGDDNLVCRRLLRDKIVVDSCSVGMEDNSELRAISFLTGGYKFVPDTLEQAMAICELEPVLSIHERPPIIQSVIAPLLTRSIFNLAAEQANTDQATRDNFPTRKPHPNLEDHFVRIEFFERRTRNASAPRTNAARMNMSGARQRRLLTEIQNIAANPHPSCDVYVSESNMGFWKVVLSGPAQSAYESGTFVLYLDMGDDYPQSPPQCRFITRIFHPNINCNGRCCHSIFGRNYTIDITNRQILDTVFGLLLAPEFTDPINTVVTLNFYWDEVAFREEVRKHIEKYAIKGREELRKEILGE